MDGWQLEEDYDRLKRQLHEKDIQLANLQESLERTSTDCKEKERGLAETSYRLQREANHAKTLEESVERLASDLSRERLARSNISSALYTAEKTIQDKDAMLQELRLHTNTAPFSSSVSNSVSELTKERDALKVQLAALRSSQSQLQDSSEITEQLRNQIEDLRAENARLQHHQTHLSAQPSTPLRSRPHGRTPHRTAGRPRSSSVSGPTTFARTTEEQNDRIIELQNEVDHLQLTRSSHLQELEGLRTKVQKLTSETLASNNSRLAMESSKNAEIESLKSMVIDLEMDVSALHQDLEASLAHAEELEAAKVDIQRLQEEKRTLERTIISFEGERKEIDNLRSQVAHQSTILEHGAVTEQQYNDLEEECRQLQSVLILRDEELDSLRALHRAHVMEKAQLEANLSNAATAMKNLEGQQALLTKEGGDIIRRNSAEELSENEWMNVSSDFRDSDSRPRDGDLTTECQTLRLKLEEAEQRYSRAQARIFELQVCQMEAAGSPNTSSENLLSMSSSSMGPPGRVFTPQSFDDARDGVKELRQELDQKNALIELQEQRIQRLEEDEHRRITEVNHGDQSISHASFVSQKSDDLLLEDLLDSPVPTSVTTPSYTPTAVQPPSAPSMLSGSSNSRSMRYYDEAKVEAMLLAIERLRAERNNLRDEVHFLRLEKRFDAPLGEGNKATAPSIQQDSAREKELLARLETVTARLEEAEEELEHAKASCEELRMQVSGMEAKIMTVENDYTSVLDKAHQLNHVVQELREKVSNHDAVQADLHSTEAELEASKEQLRKVDDECDHLRVKVELLETQSQRLTQDLDQAESRCSELRSHISSSAVTNSSLSESPSISELESRILRRTEQIGIHQHEIKRLETNLRLAEEGFDEISTELKKTEHELDLWKQEAAKNLEQSEEVARHLAEVEDSKHAVVADLHQTRTILEEKEKLFLQAKEMRTGEMATVVEILAEVAGQNRTLNINQYEDRSRWTIDLTDLKESLDSALGSKTSLKNQLDAALLDVQRLQFENTMLNEVTSNAEKSRETIYHLSEENKALSAAVIKLEAAVEQEKSSFLESQKDLEDLQSRYDDLEISEAKESAHVTTLKSELQQLEELHAATVQKLSEASSDAEDIKALRAQVEERDASVETLVSGREVLEATCKDLKQRNSDLVEQLSALEEELGNVAASIAESEANGASVEKLLMELNDRDSELLEVKAKLQRQEVEAGRVERAHETLMRSLDKVSESLGAQIKDLQAKLESAEDDVATKVSELETLHNKLETNTTSVMTLQKEVHDLQEELQSQKVESEKLLRQKVDECEAYDDRLIEADMEKKRLRAKNDALQRRLDKLAQQKTGPDPSSTKQDPPKELQRPLEKQSSLDDVSLDRADSVMEVDGIAMDVVRQVSDTRRPLALATNLSSRPQEPSSVGGEKPRPLGGLRLPPALGANRETSRPILRTIRVRSQNPIAQSVPGTSEAPESVPQTQSLLSLPSLQPLESTNSKKRPRDEADDPQRRTDPEAIVVSARTQAFRGLRRMAGPERPSGFTPVRGGQRQESSALQGASRDSKVVLPFRPLDTGPHESRLSSRAPLPTLRTKSPSQAGGSRPVR